MSRRDEHEAFLYALSASPADGCRNCGGTAADDECRLWSHDWLHPADVWTIRELRTLSINGSFR